MVSSSTDLTGLFYLAISSYALTFVMASSSLLDPFRAYVISKAPWLKIKQHRHFIECRMCVGFWMSLLVCFMYGNLHDILVVYGLSYFMATQER